FRWIVGRNRNGAGQWLHKWAWDLWCFKNFITINRCNRYIYCCCNTNRSSSKSDVKKFMNNLIKLISFFVLGGLFGAGLSWSSMLNPAKVLAFLDIFGAWDPSLILVMVGGVFVAAV